MHTPTLTCIQSRHSYTSNHSNSLTHAEGVVKVRKYFMLIKAIISRSSLLGSINRTDEKNVKKQKTDDN